MKQVKIDISVGVKILIIFFLLMPIAVICCSLGSSLEDSWKMLIAGIGWFASLAFLFGAAFSNKLFYDGACILHSRLFSTERRIFYHQIVRIEVKYRPYRLWIILKEGKPLWVPYSVFDSNDLGEFINFLKQKI